MKWPVSRHVKFIEGELIRVRLEKDAYIRTLQEEKTALLAKIDKLELAIWPLASRSGAIYATPARVSTGVAVESPTTPPTSFSQAMQQHKEFMEKLEIKEN